MKKYRRKEEILVFKWEGDVAIIDEINEILEPYNTEDCTFKVVLCDVTKILGVSHYDGYGTSTSYISFGEYVIFDPNNVDMLLGRGTDEYLESYFTEIT